MTKFDMKLLTLFLLAASLMGNSACKGGAEPEPTQFERYIQDEGIRSTILNREIRYSILLPNDYDKNTEKRYPVVYMLHGYGDDHNSWNGKYLHANDKIKYLESQGLSDMIYVFPQGFNTYYCNFYTGAFNYMDMFVQELVPYIDATYRTIPDRQHRSITGYSMGGFGAMVLPEKHPETFLCSAPLSMSFRTDAQYMAEPQSGWDNQWGSIFGGKGQMGTNRLTEYYKQHCPYYYFTDANRSALSQVKWYFTCGDDEEQLLIANDSLHVILRDRGFDHEFRVGDGAHTSSYWMGALNEVLPMFDYYMQGGTSWPGINMDVPSTQSLTLEKDGAYVSDKYKSEKTGKLIYLFHNGLDINLINKIMYLTQLGKGGAFAIIPCNVSDPNIGTYLSLYESTYPATSKYSVAVGGSGEYAFSCGRDFSHCYFVNSSTGPLEGRFSNTVKYYMACTDDSPYYTDMAELYKRCKLSEATFQYRIVKGSGNDSDDMLRLIYTLNQYINF